MLLVGLKSKKYAFTIKTGRIQNFWCIFYANGVEDKRPNAVHWKYFVGLLASFLPVDSTE